MLAALGHELRLALVALQFLTRVPIPARLGFEPQWLQDSARHFPLVGAFVGGVGAAVLAAAALPWPPAVAVGLSMAATVWLTGGFHEDGLADTCDGLGGAVGRERALQIMKDSRLGSYGALGLVAVLGLKAAALWSLCTVALPMAAAVLVLGHTASRAASVMLLRALPYAGDAEHAKAKPLAQQLGGWGAVVAAGWSALAAVAVVAVLGRPVLVPLVAGVGALVVSTLVCRRWFRRRLGGYTGDTLGAAQQFGELALLLGWLAALPSA